MSFDSKKQRITGGMPLSSLCDDWAWFAAGCGKCPIKRGNRKLVLCRRRDFKTSDRLRWFLEQVQIVEFVVSLFSAEKHSYGRVCCAVAQSATASEEKTDGSGDHINDGSRFGGEVCESHIVLPCLMSLSAGWQVGITTKVAGGMDERYGSAFKGNCLGS